MDVTAAVPVRMGRSGIMMNSFVEVVFREVFPDIRLIANGVPSALNVLEKELYGEKGVKMMFLMFFVMRKCI